MEVGEPGRPAPVRMLVPFRVPVPVRVLVADAHALVRRGLCELLEADGRIVIVAEASDGPEAVNLACRLRPAVAVIDTRMPTLSGIEATRRIRARAPKIGILMLAACDDAAYGSALIRAGADRFILKSANNDAISQAVKEIARSRRPAYRRRRALRRIEKWASAICSKARNRRPATH